VHYWATGAAVVSTYPIDVQGSATPDHDVPGRHRGSLDPDDFKAGFAVWGRDVVRGAAGCRTTG
jgi:hypothetical protein